jgi:hypothetical protein
MSGADDERGQGRVDTQDSPHDQLGERDKQHNEDDEGNGPEGIAEDGQRAIDIAVGKQLCRSGQKEQRTQDQSQKKGRRPGDGGHVKGVARCE